MIATPYIAHFDGACEPVNPGGTGGWGFVICDPDGKEFATGSGLLEPSRAMTNNVAEYTAALETVYTWHKLGLARGEHLRICGDSKLVVEQMRGRWSVKGGAYVETYLLLRDFIKECGPMFLEWQWVPRLQNARADELSKRELLARGVKITERRRG